jgi:hypothetical protein
VKWVVVTQRSLAEWLERTDPERDQELRTAVLNWVIGLVDGPPPQGIRDPFSGHWFARAEETHVWVDYLILPDLVEPTIVIREYL